MAYSGICHTQLLEARGKRGEDCFLPHTLGHEGSGTVLEIGKGVTKVKPGDCVVLSWIRGKGAEVKSTRYQGPQGLINSGPISSFMQHTVTCESRVTPIPEEIPLREAALLGCAIPTGAGVILNTIKLSHANSIGIFGVGGIGMSAILGSVLMKAAPIIAVDKFDHKLDRANKLGATHFINSGKQDAFAAIMEITDNQGLDFSIECAGRAETMELAFRSGRDKGGLCVLVGNLPKGNRFSLDPMDLIKGKRILGTWGGETQPDRDIPIYIDLYQTGRLQLDSLITHSYRLEEINTALKDLEHGRIGRGIIRM